MWSPAEPASVSPHGTGCAGSRSADLQIGCRVSLQTHACRSFSSKTCYRDQPSRQPHLKSLGEEKKARLSQMQIIYRISRSTVPASQTAEKVSLRHSFERAQIHPRRKRRKMNAAFTGREKLGRRRLCNESPTSVGLKSPTIRTWASALRDLFSE